MFRLQHVKLLVLIFIKSTFIYCESPIIKNATIEGLQSIRLEWLNNNPEAQYTRYAIQLNGSDNMIKDWPCQIEEEDSCQSTDTVETIANIESNFKCKTECIYNPKCFYYEIIRNPNNFTYSCILKSNSTDAGKSSTTVSPLTKSNQMCGRIKNYNNYALVEYLPYPSVYTFKVKVYDERKQLWSEYSNWSQNITLSLNLNIDVQRAGQTELLIKWQELKGYPISRFKVIVLKNNNIYTENTNNANNANEILTNYIENFHEKYDTLSDNINGSHKDNETQCYDECLGKQSNFVRGVFYRENLNNSINGSTCFCKTSFDISNGITKNEESTVFFINSLARNFTFTFQPSDQNFEYKIMLECTLPFSSLQTYKSDWVNYKLTALKPILTVTTDIFNLTRTLTWNLEEKIEVSRVHVTIQDNYKPEEITYYKDNDYDYVDSNDEIYAQNSFELCYKTCFQNKNCFAISYSGDECRIKKNRNALKKPCDYRTICTEILENTESLTLQYFKLNTDQCYKIQIRTFNDITGEISDSICEKSFVDNRVIKLDEFKIGNSGRLLCYHSSISDDFTKTITWKLNDEKIDSTLTNTEILDNNKILFFNNFDKSNFGSYSCEINIDHPKILLRSDVLILNDSKNESRLVIISSVLGAIIFILLIVSTIFIILFIKTKRKSENKIKWFTNQSNSSIPENPSLDSEHCLAQQPPQLRSLNNYDRSPKLPAAPPQAVAPPIPNKEVPAIPVGKNEQKKKKSTRKYKMEDQENYCDIQETENDYANSNF